MALDNFVLQNTNPLEAYLQGAGGIQTLQDNNQLMQARQLAQQQAVQKQEAAQAAALQKQQMQVDLYNTTDPLLLAKKTAAYVRANPDEWQGVAASAKLLNDAQRKSVQGITAQVTSAVASGRPELGQQAIDSYVQSLENSGAPDDQIAGAKYFQKQFSHDPKAAVMSMNLGARALDPSSYDANNKVEEETTSIVGKRPLEQADTAASTEQKIAAARKNYFDIQDAKDKNEIERLKLLQSKSKDALEQQRLQLEIDQKTQTFATDKADRVAAGRALVGGFAEMKNKALELLKDPNLDNILGSTEGRLPNLRESSAAVQSKLDTLKSGIFITVSPLLKGVATAQDAIDMKNSFAALNQTQDEKSFKTELKKLITLASKYEKQAREQFGQPDTGGGSSAMKGAPSFDIKSTSYGALLGGK